MTREGARLAALINEMEESLKDSEFEAGLIRHRSAPP